MNFATAKTVFVTHPAGCGGNHFANLLSLTDFFEPRFTSDNYHNDVLFKYKQKFVNSLNYFSSFPVAHIGDLFNISTAEKDFQLYQDKIMNSQKKYLFCTLPDEYAICTRMENHFIQSEQLSNRVFFFFSFPIDNKYALDRFLLGPWQQGLDYSKGLDFIMDDVGVNFEYSEIYNQKTFINICNDKENKYHKNNPITDDDIVVLNTDEFYTYNGIDYLNSILSKVGIELPHVSYELHRIYLEANFLYIDNLRKESLC